MSESMEFVKASRRDAYIKMAVSGASGSGKTFSSLLLAQGLVSESGKRIAFGDTENKSALLYSDKVDFDHMHIPPPYNEDKFVYCVNLAAHRGYGVLILDSFSHLWEQILAFKDALDARGGNSFTNWGKAGLKFKGVLESILQSNMHVICCMRSKMEYFLEEGADKKMKVRKAGMAPIVRDGTEYDFTTIFDIDQSHVAVASKDRTDLFRDRPFVITRETGIIINKWLMEGNHASAAAPEKTPEPVYVPQNQENEAPGAIVEQGEPIANEAPKTLKAKSVRSERKKSDNETTWKDQVISNVEEKSGVRKEGPQAGTPWTCYIFEFAKGKMAATFSKSLYEGMLEIEKDAVISVVVKPGKKINSWEIVDFLLPIQQSTQGDENEPPV